MKNTAAVLLSIGAALCIFLGGIFTGRNFTGGRLLLQHPPATQAAATAPAEKINVNTATQTQLLSIPGIGPVLAGKILAYRAENGPFTTISQLGNISGVGEKLLETLYEYATVGG